MHSTKAYAPTYELGPDWIRCLLCGLRSYHPEDIANLYCGRCHIFHEDLCRISTLSR